jgi:alkylation response protein AidB-like acyl-CoA dehydrogenase
MSPDQDDARVLDGAPDRDDEPVLDDELVLGDGLVLDDGLVLAADGSATLPAVGSELVARQHLTAEFVPERLGGRWRSTTAMVRAVRPVFRADPALGLGFGVTSLMAAATVWTAGTDAQQRAVAGVLLDGGRVAVAFHESEHGNDLTANDCRAHRSADGWHVSGTKAVVNNIDVAEAVVLMVRTAPGPGARAHSLLLAQGLASLPGAVSHGRYGTVGVRGVRLGGLDLHDVVLPADACIGTTGGAVETALRAFQITRAVVPALAVAVADAALARTVVVARDRRLYGGRVVDLPLNRAVLARTWALLLAADALAGVAVTSLHVAPRDALLIVTAAKAAVPEVLADVARALRRVGSAAVYGRDGASATVEKLLRDLEVVPVGHAGGTSCLMTILPMLPSWARRADRGESGAPPVGRRAGFDRALFEHERETATPDPSAFALGGGGDPLVSALTDPRIRDAVVDGPLDAAVRRLIDARTALVADVLGSDPAAFVPTGTDADLDLATRFADLAVGAAVLGRWHHAARTEPDDVTAGTAWARTALTAVADRLDGGATALGPELGATSHPADTDELHRELLRRVAAGVALTIDADPVGAPAGARGGPAPDERGHHR